MFKWIELSRKIDKNIWFRIDSIFQIVLTLDEDGETPDGSMIRTRNGDTFFVKELPDEIMVSIHILGEGKQYMISNEDIKNVFFDRYPSEKGGKKEVRDGE